MTMTMTSLAVSTPPPALSGKRVVPAQPMTDDAAQRQYLTFQLGAEVFAIGILAIREIIEYPALTEVPMMPDSVRGIINLRGAAVPVVDLQRRFQRMPSPVGKRTCIVIVEVADAQRTQVVGIVVDAVDAVLDIDAGSIEPAPAFGAGMQRDFIAGMARLGERFIIVLQADRLLAEDLERGDGALMTSPTERS